MLAALVVALGAAWQTSVEEVRARWKQQEAIFARDLDRLARRNRALRAHLAQERAAKFSAEILPHIEETMSKIRGLPLRRPVVYRPMARRSLRAFIAARIRSQYRGEELRDYQTALVRMRLLPDGINLPGMVSELLSEQVAAFYDLENHELRTFEKLNLNRNVERMIVAHEVIHALQDQNFDLAALALDRKDNDDLALASAALVEGDANYHMGIYLRVHFRMRDFLGDLRFLFSQQADTLLAAPVYLRETLLFPYQEGQRFVAELCARGGIAALNKAFAQPPQSTEQVLHPEKYLSGDDAPKPVDVRLTPAPSWRWLHENTVGELGIRAHLTPLLGAERAARAAEGWGGDRYVVYETQTPADGWVLVWKTVWDTPADAREFFDAMEAAFRDRFGGGVAGRSPTEKKATADALFYSFASQKQALVLRGESVFLADAPNSGTLRGVMADLLNGAQSSNAEAKGR